MIYEFHAFRVDNRGGFYGRFALASDVEAVVRSFDLMRDEIELRRIIVLIDDRPIFQRVRIGGKSEVEWTNPAVDHPQRPPSLVKASPI